MSKVKGSGLKEKLDCKISHTVTNMLTKSIPTNQMYCNPGSCDWITTVLDNDNIAMFNVCNC